MRGEEYRISFDSPKLRSERGKRAKKGNLRSGSNGGTSTPDVHDVEFSTRKGPSYSLFLLL